MGGNIQYDFGEIGCKNMDGTILAVFFVDTILLPADGVPKTA
jgi:hypothetical protein